MNYYQSASTSEHAGRPTHTPAHSPEIIRLPYDTLAACAKIEDRLSQLGTSGELVQQLFERLTLASSAGHTIFGTKPLTELLIRTSSASRPTEYLPEQAEWSAWLQVLNPSFLSTSLTIRKTNEQFVLNSPEGLPTTYGRLLIYNQKNIVRLVERNGNAINRAMGGELSAADITTCLSSDDGFALIRKNHEMLGILYGYGAGNSQVFTRLSKLREISPEILPDPRQRSHLASETLNISRSLRLITQLDSHGLPARNGVNFKGIRDSEETRILHHEYQETVSFMEKLSKCGVLAQAALAQWTGLLEKQ